MNPTGYRFHVRSPMTEEQVEKAIHNQQIERAESEVNALEDLLANAQHRLERLRKEP